MKLIPITFLFTLFLVGCSTTDNSSSDDASDDPNNTDPISFTLLSETNTFPQLPQGMVQDAQNRPYFYVAMKAGGVVIYNDSAQQITSVSTANFDGLHVMNITQEANYLYVALGDFFNSSGSKAGLAIIDVSTPKTPFVTDVWTTQTTLKGSAVVKVQDNYAYLGAMNQGVFVLNISDKNSISETSQFIPDPNFPTPNPNNIQEPNARGMDIKNNLLFLCYDAGGIRVLDITDRANVTEIGRYINENIDKQQAYNNILINGNLAYVGTDFCGMEILDISNPANPTRLSWLNPWDCGSNTNTWFNSEGHINQLGHDPSANLIFLSAGRSEMVIVDVSDSSNPVLVSTYGNVNNQKGVWGISLKGNKAHLLYITSVVPFVSTFAGIRVVEWQQN